MTNDLEILPLEWRQRAQYLRQYGDSNTARLWELAADELDRALQAAGEQALTLSQASKLSGLTPDYLSSLIKQGRITAAHPYGLRVERSAHSNLRDLVFLRPSDRAELGRLRFFEPERGDPFMRTIILKEVTRAEQEQLETHLAASLLLLVTRVLVSALDGLGRLTSTPWYESRAVSCCECSHAL